MNILIFSGEYRLPIESERNNHAIEHLVHEMHKQGHSVVVILNDIRLRPLCLCKKEYNWSGENIKYEYDVDGVSVLLNHIQVVVPYLNIISIYDVIRAEKKIEKYLKSIEFVPEIVLVHFGTMQWPILKRVLKRHGWIPTFTFHNADLAFPWVIRKITKFSNSIGVRSPVIHQKINSICASNVNAFQVNSGFPDRLLNENRLSREKGDISHKSYALLYAGLFQVGKKVDITLKALAELKDKYDFHFDIIGDGEMKQELQGLVSNLGLEKKVTFHGKQSRDYVIERMLRSDCFVMVSSPETLGLVYMEALGCGCFVIGSKGEGIDGIIIDKENGLLVTPGSVDELTEAFEYYFNLSVPEFSKILSKAHQTALHYTESAVAKKYLEDAMKKR